ncbi:hypothetical protein GPDM_06755 [Planococcus donghaensis MPA1U2]|uniref:Uncharacterized protein n=1 Tax=Planococcus donghaensis MPA1U2 TaxID=933115 RepID=E7RFV3_9BACL|nr:hypothetical protein GPDM_06755 [Planococcus donghaensis MPA1U2]
MLSLMTKLAWQEARRLYFPKTMITPFQQVGALFKSSFLRYFSLQGFLFL